jgi:uncharacterized membrane protein YbaN (DUF454 family)
MRNLTWILIALSAVGFVLAVLSTLLDSSFMNITAEGFSRSSNNLALIVIALLLASPKKGN